MNFMINAFCDWWNEMARVNGKVKFRNAQEARKFVERVARETSGPNLALTEMRREYEAIRNRRAEDRSSTGELEAAR